MNNKTLVMVLACVCALVALSGCSGGSSLSPEEYSAQLQKLDDDSEARQGELGTAFQTATGDIDPAGALTPDVVTAIRTYYEGLLDVGKDFVNEVDDLAPPSEVKNEHDEFIDTYDEVLVELSDVVDGIGLLVTAADLAALTSNQDLAAALREANAACASLQQSVIDAGGSIDLECRS
jgi:hypothetical protein